MATQRNDIQACQATVPIHCDRGNACTEIDQCAPFQLLLFRQDQIGQCQRRDNDTCHIDPDLLRHIRGYGMAEGWTADEQLIAGFYAGTALTHRVSLRLVVEVISGSSYIQHIQHIGTILPAFLV